MIFPSNFIDILNDRSVPRKSIDTEPAKIRSLVDQLTGKSLLTLSMNSYVNDTISENLTGWTVTEANSRQIVVKLALAQPLLVSQGDKPDELYVLLNLSSYSDTEGQHLPKYLLKIVKIPP